MVNGNRVSQLFNIQYPIIQAGMVWCSGWKLASAVSNAGGLGLIGAGSMHPETLLEHIQKCKHATTLPFGINVPLLYPEIERLMKVIVSEQVKIVFTSAGNPATWTGYLKDHGVVVAHVVSSTKFARKCEQAGVDAVVAEGFEAGGHNGREETTTLCLLPMVRDAISLPLIAAGGIASGQAMVAVEALGAEGFQIGSRFAVSKESSAHPNYKERVVRAGEGETLLTLKALTPVRLLRNRFADQVQEAEKRGADNSELSALLGKGRAKQGIFEGNLEEGELEVGQVSASLQQIQSAGEIINDLWSTYLATKSNLCKQ